MLPLIWQEVNGAQAETQVTGSSCKDRWSFDHLPAAHPLPRGPVPKAANLYQVVGPLLWGTEVMWQLAGGSVGAIQDADCHGLQVAPPTNPPSDTWIHKKEIQPLRFSLHFLLRLSLLTRCKDDWRQDCRYTARKPRSRCDSQPCFINGVYCLLLTLLWAETTLSNQFLLKN